MCIVEISGSIKPIISCCTLIKKSMKLFTKTRLVRKLQENILEFLLLNHPLDCPICDQAGECDLQDISYVFGPDESRNNFTKKSILDKNLNFFIKTNMNRCIYCTRCVRFNLEYNNEVSSFSTLGRGIYTEVSTYYKNKSISFTNNIDGNVIDLCPVNLIINI